MLLFSRRWSSKGHWNRLTSGARGRYRLGVQAYVVADKLEISSMRQSQEKQFDQAMLRIYQRAKLEAGYNATVFLRMLHDRGALSTAKYLVNTPKPSEGYTHLYERGRLDLTVEALIVEEERWHPLFTEEEIAKAKRRLGQYGYKRAK